jgi:hypothetical protein
MIEEKNGLADQQFRIKYNLLFGLLLLSIGIASVADFLNAFYGTGWDPLEMRVVQNDATGQAIVAGLTAVAILLGVWRVRSALLARRNLPSKPEGG